MGKKLLVADDSVTIQKVIKLALSSEGYDILAVSEGNAAIQAIENEMPDVVLIDVALPTADAYAVKKAINNIPHLSGVGFILMASAFERVDEQQFQDVGFHARLIKPFDPAHLRKTVAQVLEKSKVERPKEGAPIAKPQAIVAKKETSRVFDTLASAPTPPPPPVVSSSEDLPPMSDMMPMLNEGLEPAVVTEDEFKLEISENAQSPAQEPADEVEEEVTQTRSLENDIKDLTESTIKMSGLDDFEWNLDDSKKMRTSGVGSGQEKTKTLEVSQPVRSLKPDPVVPDFTVLPRSIDDGGSNFLSMGVGGAGSSSKLKGLGIGAEHAATEIPGLPPLVEIRSEDRFSEKKEQAAPALNRAEMEQLIRREFEQAIERIARDVVPQIAETLIRKEIEKILAEN